MPEFPFISTRTNTLMASFEGTACLQPVALQQSKEHMKERIDPRTAAGRNSVPSKNTDFRDVDL